VNLYRLVILILLIFSNGFSIRAFALELKPSRNTTLTSISRANTALDQFLANAGYSKIALFTRKGSLYAEGKVGDQAVYVLIDTGSNEASVLESSVPVLKLSSSSFN